MRHQVLLLIIGLQLATLVGCEKKRIESTVTVTATNIRAARRAYNGAPSVIPHPPLGASCTSCHTDIGSSRPGIGFAPANPHLGTRVEGAVQNCVQCHVFKHIATTFVGSTFVGRLQDVRPAARRYLDGPPVMPHAKFMRENCHACHTSPAARPEIRCTHPERTNCLQCHLERNLTATASR